MRANRPQGRHLQRREGEAMFGMDEGLFFRWVMLTVWCLGFIFPFQMLPLLFIWYDRLPGANPIDRPFLRDMRIRSFSTAVVLFGPWLYLGYVLWQLSQSTLVR